MIPYENKGQMEKRRNHVDGAVLGFVNGDETGGTVYRRLLVETKDGCGPAATHYALCLAHWIPLLQRCRRRSG